MKEIEKRGPLSSNQLDRLTIFLEKEGVLVKQESEKVIFFETKNFPSIGDFKSGLARISLKSDKKESYIRIKEGNPSATTRSEYSVRLNTDDISNMIYILSRLGLTHGFYRPTNRKDYQYANLTISIKTNCVMGDHFEIELNDVNLDLEEEIQNLLHRIELNFWTTEEYKYRIQNLMKTNPAINIIESKIFA